MSEHDDLIAQIRRGGLMTIAAHERAADALAALVRERDEARACAAESAAILRRVQDSRADAIARLTTERDEARTKAFGAAVAWEKCHAIARGAQAQRDAAEAERDALRAQVATLREAAAQWHDDRRRAINFTMLTDTPEAAAHALAAAAIRALPIAPGSAPAEQWTSAKIIERCDARALLGVVMALTGGAVSPGVVEAQIARIRATAPAERGEGGGE